MSETKGTKQGYIYAFGWQVPCQIIQEEKDCPEYPFDEYPKVVEIDIGSPPYITFKCGCVMGGTIMIKRNVTCPHKSQNHLPDINTLRYELMN